MSSYHFSSASIAHVMILNGNFEWNANVKYDTQCIFMQWTTTVFFVLVNEWTNEWMYGWIEMHLKKVDSGNSCSPCEHTMWSLSNSESHACFWSAKLYKHTLWSLELNQKVITDFMNHCTLHCKFNQWNWNATASTIILQRKRRRGRKI